jgi:hypothetical protein
VAALHAVHEKKKDATADLALFLIEEARDAGTWDTHNNN